MFYSHSASASGQPLGIGTQKRPEYGFTAGSHGEERALAWRTRLASHCERILIPFKPEPKEFNTYILATLIR